MGCNLLHSIYVIVTESAHQFLTMYIIAGVLVLVGLGWIIRRMTRGSATPSDETSE